MIISNVCSGSSPVGSQLLEVWCPKLVRTLDLSPFQYRVIWTDFLIPLFICASVVWRFFFVQHHE